MSCVGAESLDEVVVTHTLYAVYHIDSVVCTVNA